LFFFAIFGCGAHFKSIAMKWLEIDQDNLRTGSAIGFRASRKHYLKFLVILRRHLLR